MNSKQNVRKDNPDEIKLDYEKISEKVKGIVEPYKDITERSVTLLHDGKQFTVKIPKAIERILGLKKGDKLLFKIIVESHEKKPKIEVEHIHE